MYRAQCVLLASCLSMATLHFSALSYAENLLSDGDFEAFAVVPGWSLVETVTDLPGANVSSAVQRDFANQPSSLTDEFGLWLQAFNGNQNQFKDQNRKINAELSQVVSATPGETYNWSGWSNFQQNYSGGVDTLDSLSPSGAVASPTETIWELAFLDSSDTVLGEPVILDLRDDQFSGAGWMQHTLSGVAPTDAARVRVTASAYDMVFNLNPNQSAFFDNFSLTTAATPAAELLTNANLNGRPVEFANWEVTEEPVGTNNAAVGGEFANDPATGGSAGFWMRAFAGGDAVISQTIPGIEGGAYTFTASSAWEQNYTGGFVGTETETFMELAFLNDQGGEIELPLRLNLFDAGQTNAPGPEPILEQPEAWSQFSVDGTAPEGTASVRVTAGALGMIANTVDPFNQSAFFDDLILTVEVAGLPGDYNNDGLVDAVDYAAWREQLGAAAGTLPNDIDGGQIGTPQFLTWRGNFGALPPQPGGSTSVPEPAALALGALALLAAGGRCQKIRTNRSFF